MKITVEIDDNVADQVKEAIDKNLINLDAFVEYALELLKLNMHIKPNIVRENSNIYPDELIGDEESSGDSVQNEPRYEQWRRGKALRLISSNTARSIFVREWALLAHTDNTGEPFTTYEELYRKIGIKNISKFDNLLRNLELDGILCKKGDLVTYDELRKKYDIDLRSKDSTEDERLLRYSRRKIYASERIGGTWLKQQVIDYVKKEETIGD